MVGRKINIRQIVNERDYATRHGKGVTLRVDRHDIRLAGRQALQDIEDAEDVMGQPLLEKAGLQRPSKEERERPMNFDPGEFFKCDCKVCDLTKEGGIVIFDDSAYEDEEILLD